MRLFLSSLIAFLTLAGPAAAWSPPTDLQTGLRGAAPTGLITTSHGAVLGAYDTDSTAGSRGMLAYGSPLRTKDTGAQIAVGPVAFGAGDDAMLMPVRYGRIVGGYVQETLYLRSVVGATGALSTSTALVRDARIDDEALAGSRSGQVAAAWSVHGAHASTLRYVIRSAGGKLGAVQTVSTKGLVEGVQLAFDDHDNLLITYAREQGGKHRMIARIAARGKAAGAESDIGAQTGQLSIAAAGQSNGRFAVAWQTQDPAGAGPGFAPRTYVAARSGGKWSEQTLDPGTAKGYAAADVQLALGSGDALAVGWSAPDAAGAQQPRIAEGTLGSKLTVHQPAGPLTVDGLVIDTTGTTAFGTSDTGGLQSINRPAGAPEFNGPVALDPDPSAANAILSADGKHALWTAGASGNQSVRFSTQ